MQNTQENAYISMFTAGFGIVVEKALKLRFSDAKILELTDGMVIYQTGAPVQKVRHNPIFTNTFVLIATGSSKKKDEKSLLHLFNEIELENLKKLKIPSEETFRLMYSQQGQLMAIDRKSAELIENGISSSIGIKINRHNPSIEFWFIERENGKVYFALRLTYHKTFEKLLNKGELHPDTAALLCYMSDPQKSDVLLDPFCGFGAIPIARSKIGDFASIYGTDSDGEKIYHLKQKFETEDMKFLQKEVAELPFTNGEITKIVTDPPWGVFNKELDIDFIYETAFKEFYRVLADKGVIVVVTHRQVDLSKYLNKRFVVSQELEVLVSGQKATVRKLSKKV